MRGKPLTPRSSLGIGLRLKVGLKLKLSLVFNHFRGLDPAHHDASAHDKGLGIFR